MSGSGSKAEPWITGPPPPPPDEPSGSGSLSGSESGSGPGSGSGRRAIPRWDWSEWAKSASSDARRVAPQLLTDSLFIVAGVAILIAYALGWVAAILTGLRHAPGLSGQDRALSFLGVGSVGWAAIVLFGTALVALGRRFEMGESDEPAEVVLTGLLIAAALTVVAAGFGVLAELTNFGHGIDTAFTGLVTRLAALPIAGVAAWWAWQQREDLRPLPRS